MAGAKFFALAVVLATSIPLIIAFDLPNEESVLVIGSGGPGAHALQASPLQHGGRRLMQRQMLGEPEPTMKWLVDKHNELRARHGVPPMVWDWGLAWNAYNYVLNCPSGHSGQPGIGENLAWGHNDFNHAMRDWYDEIQFYNFNRPSFAENTGHFSAMVWKDSNRIGCAANLRCRFKTWICQFTPPGNFVLAGGGVDYALWSSQVLPPSAQFVTGSRPDGSPSYASYDPTGESTRGLPSPQYGELKNFGYVPKPGSSIIMYDWQRFVPTTVLTQHIPAPVLAQYLDNDTLAMLAPDAKGDVQTQRTLVGWQRAIPASVIQQYVPAEVLAQYVPEGVVMATTGPTDSPLSKSAQHAAAASKDGKHSKAAPAAAPAAASASASSATAVPDSSVDAVVAIAAAVHKPRSGLAGLLDDLRGSRSNEQQPPLPTTAYIVPVQQVQPASTMQMQQPQQMVLVQPANGGPAYYMPVTAVQPANAPMEQQQFVATSVQQQPQQVFLAPGNTAAVRQVPAVGVAGSDSFQQGPAGAGSYPGYGPAVGRAGPSVVGAAGPSRDMQQALDRHNIYRRRHQAVPLVWDAQMAAQAAEFAASCPTGRSGKAGLGENLAFGYPDAASAVDAWYGQVSSYNFAAPSFYPAAAQFSQLVWAGSEKVGCAVAAGCSMPTFVCNYYPAGNVIGRHWASNVRAPAEAVPKTFLAARPPAQVMAVAAVDKPSKPTPGVARAVYTRVGEPLTNDGAPISRSSPPQQHATAAVLSPELQAALDRHNTLRAKHGAPALEWDAAIATTSQSWAAGCPNGHSGQRGVGENMAWGYASLADAVQAWYDEVKLYDFASPGWSPSTGHFTQIVWLSTTRLGCAINTACSWPTYVCQYGPPGNVLGIDWSKQVQREGTALPPSANPNPATGGSPTTAGPAPARSPPPVTATPRSPTPPSPSPSPKPAVVVTKPKPSPSPSPRPAVVRASPSPSPQLAAVKPLPSPSPRPAVIKASPSPAPRPSWPGFTPVGPPRPKPSPSPAAVAAGPKDAELLAAFSMINGFRKTHQAPALAWDEKLAASAQAWAATCQFAVSGMPGVAEGLGYGYSSLPEAIKDWYAQVSAYDFSKPGWSSSSGLFSQMVWRDSTAVGCALNRACPWAMYACHYSPPGNMVGPGIEWSKQVMPAVGALTSAAVPKPAAVLKPGKGIDSLLAGLPFLSSRGASFAQPEGPSDPALAAALTKTNALRARHQVSALSWDDELAAQAAAYVADCPKTNSAARGVGENMAWGFHTFDDAVDAWAGESHSYNFSSPGFSLLAGHFSQLVWRSSNKMGCAVNAGCELAVYSCLYYPPGNDVEADWSEQVMPDVKRAEGEGVAVTDAPYSTWAPAVPVPADAASGGDGSSSISKASDVDATTYIPFNVPDGVPPGSLVVPDTWSNQQQQQQQDEVPPEEQPVPVQQQQQQGDAADTPAVEPAPLKPGSPVPTMPASQFYAPPAVKPAPTTPTPAEPATPATPPTPDTATPPPPASPTDEAVAQPPPAGAPAQQQPPSTPAPSTSTAAPTAATDPSVPAEYASVLAATNAYRAKHQAPALAWDAALAARAQAYAGGCPNGHSGDRGVGENMAWGYQSWQAAVDGWYNEVEVYNFARPGFSGATGHFTQLVWKDTTSIGCGLNTRCGMATYVCQYAPAGNVMGIDWSRQVMPAKQ